MSATHAADGASPQPVAGPTAARSPDDAGGPVFHDRIPVVPRFFTGRDDVLSRLGSSSIPGRATVLTQAIQGLGGVGKTSVAAAFAEARRDDVEILWWVRAEEPATLVSDLVALAPHVGAPLLDDPMESAALVRRELETTDRSWLLVFDNAPDQRSVEEWLPRRGVGLVVITSRSPNFSLADEVVVVDTFPPDVARTFLRQRVAQANPAAAIEDLDATVERLGGLPLALEQAGAWVAQVPNRRFARFVELYDSVAQDPFPDGTRPSGYEHTATTTWRVSMNAASTEAPLAKPVMAVLSFLAPDQIPCAWLREMGDDETFDRAGAAAIGAALDALHAYSLARIAPDDTIRIHRVIQAVTRRGASREAATAAIRALRRQCPEEPFDDRHWPTLALIATHALVVAETATAALPEAAHDLCSTLNLVARYEHDKLDLWASIALASSANRIAGTHLGPDHPETLLSRLTWDSASQMAGNRSRPLVDHEAFTATCEAVFGRDHPTTLHSRNSLAYAYQIAGQVDRAVILFESTLAACEQAVGPDDMLTIISRNNLAYAYKAAGDPNRAIPLLESTLADKERRLGPDHPSALISRNNLAEAFQSAGAVDRAIAIFEETLVDRARVLGAEHPHTLLTRIDLAGAYLERGEVVRAADVYRSAFADCERVLGGDHPMTVACHDGLRRSQSPP
jgi:tetratricopeptide (TPR) repeat protein